MQEERCRTIFSGVHTSKDMIDRQGRGVLSLLSTTIVIRKRFSVINVLECSGCGGRIRRRVLEIATPASRSFVEKTVVFSFGKPSTAVLCEALEAIKERNIILMFGEGGAVLAFLVNLYTTCSWLRSDYNSSLSILGRGSYIIIQKVHHCPVLHQNGSTS